MIEQTSVTGCMWIKIAFYKKTIQKMCVPDIFFLFTQIIFILKTTYPIVWKSECFVTK